MRRSVLRGLALAASLGALGCGLAGNGLQSTPLDAGPCRADECSDAPTDATPGRETGADDADAADVALVDARIDADDANAAGDAFDGTVAEEGGDAPDGGAPSVVARLNIDGPTYDGIDYPGTWMASPVPGVCGPTHYEATAPLHGTRDAPLFEGEAFGNPMTCAVGTGLAPGTYRVRLYFAENYWGPGCPGGGGVGSRVFDIVLEGATVLPSFDVFAESGGCLASTTSGAGVPVVKTFDIAVSDGTLDISLPASADSGKLSALEVFGPL